MTILKNLRFILLVIIAVSFLPQTVEATHIVGGNMTYRCLGNDQYEVTLTFRRDCENGANDAPLDDPATFGIYDRFGSLQLTLGDELGRTFVPIQTREVILADLNEDCIIGNTGNLCVEEAIYRDTLTLPFNKLGYFISYQRCCRNVILNNIDNPLQVGATYHTFIDIGALEECNSQPVFNGWPEIFACQDQPFVFDHSGVDTDGDDIVYRLCAPSSGASFENPFPSVPSSPPYDDVVFSNGHSLGNVLGSGIPLMIDEQTGLLTATPGTLGTYLVGICMQEFRNGVLLSEVRRDFEITVVPCTDAIEFTQCNVQGTDCNGGNTVSLSVASTNADNFTWFFDWPNTDPAFVSSGPNQTFTYPQAGQYTVRIEAQRESDGCVRFKDTEITVGGIAPTAEFTAIPINCSGDQVTVQFSDSTIGDGNYTQSWIVDGTTFSSSPFTLTFDRAETIRVDYSLVTPEGCESIQNQSINLEDLINSAFFDVDLITCSPSGNTIQLTNPAGTSASWTITDGNGNTQTASGAMATITVLTDLFTVTFENDNGCNIGPISETFSIDDFIDNAFDVNITSCSTSGNTFTLTNNTNANVTWTIQDGSNSVDLTGDFVSFNITSGTFIVTANYDNSCYGTLTESFNANDFITPDIDIDLVSCGPNGNIINIINPSGTIANWTINNTTTAIGHTVTTMVTGEVFTVTIDLDNGCSGPFTRTFNINEFITPIVAEFTAIPITCSGDQVTLRFDDITISDGSFTQEWIVDGNTFTSSPFTLTFNRNQTIRVDYSVTTTNGCSSSTQNQSINLEELINSAFFELELVSCSPGANTIMLTNPAGTPTTWILSNGTTLSGPSVQANVSESIFSVTMIADNGCDAIPITQTFNLDDLINAAISVDLISCGPNGNLFSFTNTTNANVFWTIEDGNSAIISETGSVITANITSSTFTVTAAFDNSCFGTITQTFNADEFLTPDIEISAVTCTDNGNIINITNPSSTVANWTIDDGTTVTNEVGHTITATIVGDIFSVTIDLGNGCSGPLTETFDLRQFVETPVAQFTAIPLTCSGDEVTVRFEDSSIGNQPYTQSWSIGGSEFSSSPFTLTFNRNETIRVDYSITTLNGCGTSIQNQSIDLEDLINSPFFDLDLVECAPTGNTILLTNPAGTPTTWTITDTQGTTTLMGPSVQTTVVNTMFSVTMAADNGCEAVPVTQNFDLNEILDAAISVNLISCSSSGNQFSFTNNTANANVSWIIQDGPNNMFTLNGDFVTGLITSNTFTVTASFDNACYGDITRTLNADDFRTPEIDVELESCGPNGNTYNFENTQMTVGTWTIESGGVVIATEVGHTITATINADNFSVTLNVDNGCSGPITETFSTTDLEPTIAILDNVGNDCIPPSGQVVTLSSSILNNAINSNPIGLEWVYNISSGPSMTSMNPSIDIELLPGDVINAQLSVTYANGCVFSVSDVIQARNSGTGELEIVNDANSSCISAGGQIITFSTNLDPNQISTYNWVYNILGAASQTSNEPTISVSVMPRQSLEVSLSVTLTDGCTLQNSTTFTPLSSPDLDIAIQEDCSDPDQTVITLTDATNIVGFAVSSREWIVNNQPFSNEATIMIGVINAPVTVQYNVEYVNGCTATFTRTFNPADYQPTVDYDVECIGDGIFEFTYTGFVPDCLDLNSVNWTINGMSFTGPVVRVELPPNTIITVDVTGTYSNGEEITLSEDVDTNSFLEMISFDVTNNLPGTCLDTFDLSVDGSMGGTFIWSDDPDFNNILQIGTTFMGMQSDLSSDSVFVQFISEDRCGFGESLEILDNNMVDISFDMPFINCPGDTTMIEVNNLNADQDITYLWKDSNGFIVDGGDTSSPTIGVPSDQSDDFFMILCTSNQFACERSDTIRFEIGSPEDLSFTYMAVECGSLSVMFMSGSVLDTSALQWDFGDGNMSNETNPTHTYDMEGNYTVTLSSNNMVCGGEPVSMEIELPDLPLITVESDTIIVPDGGVAVLEADTSEPGDSVTWCLTTGEEIGTGNPLEYMPVMDTTIVIAKFVDDKGCTAQDTTVLVPEMMEDDDSLDDISVDGPMTVCANDTFELTVAFEAFNEETFSIDWNPDECIVSGENAATVTVTAETDKVFDVLVTNLESGEDTIITFPVVVENVPISITADNGIPGQENLPQVCLGSNITLSAMPGDDNCDFEWSTGESGTSIEVSPDEETTFSLTCTTPLGCVSEASSTVTVLPPQCNEDDIFVPSAFSPNEDGVNDRLFVRSKFIQNMEFFIVNRWGQEVWRTTNQEQGWDGTFEGETLSPDVYAYCLVVTCVNDTEFTTTGNVSIIK